ncbi:MAG TPA: OmpA family protein [Steroidobacteraceae bacterium]|nr:OmpA family protein [Steroidobacteraceae bacterium]
MSGIRKRSAWLLSCLTLIAMSAQAQTVGDSPLGSAIERQLPMEQPFTPRARDPAQINTEAGDTLKPRPVLAESFETVKLKNVIPPIHFDSGVARIPDNYLDTLRKALDALRDRRNVRLHLVGHADSQPLSPALARTFGDNAGLSRERAGEVAEFLKRAMQLKPESVEYEWAGDTHPIASNDTAAGRALNRRVEVEVWYDQPKAREANDEVLVREEIKQVKVCRVQTLCKLRFKEGAARRSRLSNVVPPLHYGEDNVQVTPEFIEHIRKALNNLRDKSSVVVKFIGYTDQVALSERDARIYGDLLALSKARAHRVALAVQEALKLPGTAVTSDGRGAAAPLAPNDTAQGRALNRRIEVQFWYDDPLRELPDEPQMCPNPGSEIITKVYEPAWGSLAPLQLTNGRAIIPPGYIESLRRAMADVRDKSNVRLRFVGYTANEPLDRRTAAVYGDDVGLSAARARRAMELVTEQMHLSASQAEHEGRGFVQSSDVVNVGFTQGESSYVVVQVVYDEPAILDDYEGVTVTPLTHELTPQNPLGVNTMHITVDGVPIDDPGRSSADVQRCTDVALDKADIRFQFDDLKARRRLSVAVAPSVVEFQRSPVEGLIAAPVRFQMYTNYAAFIARAEVRIFEAGRSAQSTPLAVVPIDPNGSVEWQPLAQQLSAAGRELKYLVRAYGKDGKFDETKPASLWMVDDGSRAPDRPTAGPPSGGDYEMNDSGGNTKPPGNDAPGAGAKGGSGAAPPALRAPAKTSSPAEAGGPAMGSLLAAVFDADPSDGRFVLAAQDPEPAAQPAPVLRTEPELLAAYGESTLADQNIRVSGGTVTVHGGGIPPGHTVWVAGHQVPVDAKGNFVAEDVLPNGVHTVEVAVLDQDGNGTLYLRDLEFKPKDRFFFGMADLTLSKNHTTTTEQEMQGANAPFDYDAKAYGSLSFFGTQKFSNDWKVTASADTREEPFKDLFSDFLNKAPDSLFRRIDPDYYYPTYGDDSTVQELAPTLGKFYVKAEHHDDYGLWGNFRINYLDNELTQVDRGLYGGNIHWLSDSTTSFGEKRITLDGFAAQPGTIAGRDEFQGTGGSLYFLREQDILTGSEQVRIELRDKDSGLVMGTVNLRPSIDYEIDYLQGRIVLAEPLSSTAADNLLVRTSGLSGQLAYLVVRYEYTPAFSDIHTWTTGGQADAWINNYVRLGVTASSNDMGVDGSSVRGADVLLRRSADSWVKLQSGKSEGLASSSFYSNDGGFGFTSYNPASFANANADAYRADVSLGLGDILAGTKGRMTYYTQHLDAGYSAPGFDTLTPTDYSGGTLTLPMGDRWSVNAKADRKAQEEGLTTTAAELDLAYKLSKHWSVSSGVRRDDREDNSPLVPATQQQGERTDVVAQLGYDSLARWRAYTFAQDTVSKSGDREDNGRGGVGGSYRVTDALRVDAEASGGNLGPGGKLGTSYLVSEHTTLYLNYSLENELADTGLFQRQGTLVSGMKERLTDSSSVYVEERYQDIDSASGLTHATGVTLRPDDRWNLGANAEVGTLVDSQTDAQTKRKAGGIRVGYGHEKIQFSSGVEYRDDEMEQPDATSYTKLKTWLFRNNFKYQLTPDWRLLGKLDHSMSNASQGQFYDGGYTQAVVGYGYRPVQSDRLDVLGKYTYFYNVPTAGQVTPQDTAAQFIQKSRIASIDVSYDLTRQWTVGGKYAYRTGEASLERVNPQFFDNTAQLYIVRVDWHFRQEWEGMVEGRTLEMPDLNQTRSGALVAFYRHLGKHVKAGLGYNFTNFSEDLTDMSFKSHGIFMNVVGAM